MSSSEVTDSEKVAPLIVRTSEPDAILAHLLAISELQHDALEKSRNSRFRSSLLDADMCDSNGVRLLIFRRQL